MEEQKKKQGKKITGKKVLLALIILVLIFGSLITFITDYMWFNELGYVSVFHSNAALLRLL